MEEVLLDGAEAEAEDEGARDEDEVAEASADEKNADADGRSDDAAEAFLVLAGGGATGAAVGGVAAMN